MKLARLLILFIALSLALPAARAESLFSLLATPAPAVAAPTAAPVPTAVPAPAVDANASALFFGLSYGDMAGKKADRAVENKSEGTTEYLYDHVTSEDFQRYEAFLTEKGCQFMAMSADTANAAASAVYQNESGFGFLMLYESDKQVLTLIYFPDTIESEDTADQNMAGSETYTEEKTASVCPWCDRGYCSVCHGRGVVKCSSCGGLGSCGACHGKRTHYSPGYGGVGTGSYSDCTACAGSGRCYACGGAGRVECGACDGGVCSACHGDYRHFQ